MALNDNLQIRIHGMDFHTADETVLYPDLGGPEAEPGAVGLLRTQSGVLFRNGTPVSQAFFASIPTPAVVESEEYQFGIATLFFAAEAGAIVENFGIYDGSLLLYGVQLNLTGDHTQPTNAIRMIAEPDYLDIKSVLSAFLSVRFPDPSGLPYPSLFIGALYVDFFSKGPRQPPFPHREVLKR